MNKLKEFIQNDLWPISVYDTYFRNLDKNLQSRVIYHNFLNSRSRLLSSSNIATIRHTQPPERITVDIPSIN